MQIGGGVQVSDAFQAMMELQLIAIWGRMCCVEISQARYSNGTRRTTREIRCSPFSISGLEAAVRAGWTDR